MAKIAELTQPQEAVNRAQVQPAQAATSGSVESPRVNKHSPGIGVAKRAFVEWLAVPKQQRHPATQKQFAERYGVSERAVWRWKHDPRILVKAEKLSVRFARLEFADVLDCIVAEATGKTGGPEVGQALGGNVTAQRLFLQYVMGWHEPGQRDETDKAEEWTGTVVSVAPDGTKTPRTTFPNLPTRREPKLTRVN